MQITAFAPSSGLARPASGQAPHPPAAESGPSAPSDEVTLSQGSTTELVGKGVGAVVGGLLGAAKWGLIGGGALGGVGYVLSLIVHPSLREIGFLAGAGLGGALGLFRGVPAGWEKGGEIARRWSGQQAPPKQGG